jgi:hypothetical protein
LSLDGIRFSMGGATVYEISRLVLVSAKSGGFPLSKAVGRECSDAFLTPMPLHTLGPAAVHYRQALALADELGMRPLQAHCHRGLGTLYATTGQREQARAELSTAMEMYQAMEMTFWLPETEVALAQVEREH